MRKQNQHLKFAKRLQPFENLPHGRRKHLQKTNKFIVYIHCSIYIHDCFRSVHKSEQKGKDEPRSRISPSFPSHKLQSLSSLRLLSPAPPPSLSLSLTLHSHSSNPKQNNKSSSPLFDHRKPLYIHEYVYV